MKSAGSPRNSWDPFPMSPRASPGLLTVFQKSSCSPDSWCLLEDLELSLTLFKDELAGSARLEVLDQLHKPGRMAKAFSYKAGRVGQEGLVKSATPTWDQFLNPCC